MKNYSKLIFSAITGMLFSSSVFAQNNALATGYFTDGFIQKTKLNPAFTLDRNYFALPLLNATIGLRSNLAVADVLYPTSNGLQTFLHPEISAETAMKHIAEQNYFNGNLGINFLDVGWWNSKGTLFNTVDVGIKIHEFSNLPGDLFAMAKGSDKALPEGKNYNMSGLGINMMAYLQFAFGQSIKLPENVRLGYRAKFLIGGLDLSMRFDQFNAELAPDKWLIGTNASINATGLRFNTKKDGDRTILDFSSPTVGGVENMITKSFQNLGFAFDLGLTWDFTEWGQASISVQDLGVLFFKNTQRANSVLNGMPIDYSKGGSVTKIEDMFKRLGDVAKFTPEPELGSINEMLPAVIRAGVQVRIPQYQKFSVGALYTQQIYKNFNWWELRASANYDVARWFSFSLSYGYGTFKHQFGGLLTFHAPGINFFLGADNIPLSYSMQGIPVKTGTTTVSFGLGFMFGKYKGRYPKLTSNTTAEN